MATITTTIVLSAEVCGSCGINFAFPDWFMASAKRDHSVAFYCPNGHRLTYQGPTEADKLREQLKAVQDRAIRQLAEADQLRAALQDEGRHHAATKGKLTKLKNRVAAGVCTECNRTFPNLASHMADKHHANDYAGHEHVDKLAAR